MTFFSARLTYKNGWSLRGECDVFSARLTYKNGWSLRGECDVFFSTVNVQERMVVERRM